MIGALGIGRTALCGLALALGAAPAGAEEGNIFSNLLKYGGTTVPPSQPKELEAPNCPAVDVPDGGAALTNPAGATGAGIRSQVSLGRIARECTQRADGSITVKVGIEARVLLGPSGAPGRFDVPFTIAIKHDDKTVSTRTRRVAVSVGSGEAQGFATVVEDDIPVPAAVSADYEIVVGLGGAPKAAAAKPKPRRRAPVAQAPSEAPSEAPAEAGAAQ
ncbi:MAG: hypothetical protein EOO66_25570 [Methylobacterium sp.]|nr:MAG: hypothetical protein EOO66_25570 [Methylobacterium sp.]